MMEGSRLLTRVYTTQLMIKTRTNPGMIVKMTMTEIKKSRGQLLNFQLCRKDVAK
uniref:Uncharacterized protein n=2 Tax=Meloidogyne TaxID=189290 RepID=A0A6V7WEF2_MELEN|nr:unnamed protein product [Meloidogyne enterolobii]